MTGLLFKNLWAIVVMKSTATRVEGQNKKTNNETCAIINVTIIADNLKNLNRL
jgi:hypothetical protein